MMTTDLRMVGVSEAIAEIEADIDCAAASDACVLITGEAGSGKELAARLIHQRGTDIPQVISVISGLARDVVNRVTSSKAAVARLSDPSYASALTPQVAVGASEAAWNVATKQDWRLGTAIHVGWVHLASVALWNARFQGTSIAAPTPAVRIPPW